MELGFLKWGRREWRSYTIILCVMLAHLFILGYPVLTPDSIRYISASIYLTTNSYSPTLIPYLLHPIVVYTGSWGFVVVTMLLLSYALNSVLIHFKKSVLVGALALTISTLGLIANQVMMDAYTAIGLLALYLLLEERKDPVLYLLLGLSCAAHYGNTVLYALTTLVYWLLYKRGDTRKLLSLTAVFVVATAAVTSHHYLLEGQPRYSPQSSYTFLAVSLLWDCPGVTRDFMREHPESLLSKNKGIYDEITEGRRSKYGMLWEKDNIIDRMGGPIGYNGEARVFVWYAIFNHPRALLGAWSNRFLRFLVKPEFGQVLEVTDERQTLVDIVEEYLPSQRSHALNSLQYGQQLYLTNHPIFKAVYYVGYLAAASIIILSLLHRRLRNAGYYRFTVYTTSVILFNAVLMSAVGVDDRYQIRVMILSSLLLCFIASDLVKSRRVKSVFVNLKKLNCAL